MASTVTNKRKRARKACVPCHQRKRKCDAGYPCGMCTTYEYSCRYDNVPTTGRGGEPFASVPLVYGRSSRSKDFSDRRPTKASPGDSHMSNQVNGSSLDESDAARTSPAHVTGVFDEHTYRYAGQSAATAFPHVLSLSLGSESTPKMHSFAYNFGARLEEASKTRKHLGQLISEQDLATYSGIFFSTMGQVMDFLDENVYNQRFQEHYREIGSGSASFAAVAAGVAALGSLLSHKRCPRELDLVKHVRSILDEDGSLETLGIDHMVAGALRVLYLRATSRPNKAWLASCTLMHLCESMGLHEEGNIQKMASMNGDGYDADRLRRLFWIPWAGHNILSYEYDRSPVQFRSVTCRSVGQIDGSVADQFVHIAQIIPTTSSPPSPHGQTWTPRDDLFGRIRMLRDYHVSHPFLIMTKADLAFCFYRRIYHLKMGITDEVVQIIIDLGDAGVQAATELATQGRFFWNVIGSVFHYACVLLAIDTPASTLHLAATFQGLEYLVRAADTAPTREALAMAKNLLNLHTAKKRRELAQLEVIEADYQALAPEPAVDTTITMPDGMWAMDWDQYLFEPYLTMLGSDLQL